MKAFRAVQLSWHRSPLAQVAAKNRRRTRRYEWLALTPANELLNANRLGRDQDPLQIVHVPTPSRSRSVRKERLGAEISGSDPAVFFSSAPADVLDYKLHSNADIPGLSCVVTLILDK